MKKVLAFGLVSLVSGLLACASLPARYQKQTGRGTETHAQQIAYARWCADNGYWEGAVSYLEKAENEAVSEKEKYSLRQELAENYLLLAEEEYLFRRDSGINIYPLPVSLGQADFYCRKAEDYIDSVPKGYQTEKTAKILQEVNFVCGAIDRASENLE